MMSITKTSWLTGMESVLLTLWVGGLWITGYLVVPILFSVVDDRQLAGLIAGRIFQTMNYLGLGIGSFLLLATLIASRGVRFGKWRQHWREGVLLAMVLLIAIAAFILQPMMQELKVQGIAQGSTQAIQFSRLHGAASSLFLVNSVLGLLLVVSGLRRD